MLSARSITTILTLATVVTTAYVMPFETLSWKVYFPMMTALAVMSARFLHQRVSLPLTADPTSRRRRLSLVSELCARGPFPPAMNIPVFPIHNAFWVGTCPTGAAVGALVQSKLVDPHLRFRAVPRDHAAGGFWFWDAVDVDVADHISEVSLEDETSVMQYLEEQAALALSPDRPQWEIQLIKTADPASRDMVLLRISHAIGDGLSLVSVLLELLTNQDGTPFEMPAFRRRPSPPMGAIARVGTVLRFLWSAVTSVGKCVSMPAFPTDSPSAIRRSQWQRPESFRIVTTTPIEFSRIRLLKAMLRGIVDGVTVNDLVTYLLATSLRKLHAVRRVAPGEDPETGVETPRMRAMIPYAFPRKKALTNQWCFISLQLAMVDGIRDRLVATKTSLDALKASPEAYIQYGVQTIAGAVLPAAMREQSALDIFNKHSLVFTNVPGPSEPVYLCGEKVLDVMAFIGNISQQVCVLTYGGMLQASLTVDPEVVPDPEEWARLFVESLDELENWIAQ